jgi:hypothetical protein
MVRNLSAAIIRYTDSFVRTAILYEPGKHALGLVDLKIVKKKIACMRRFA